MTIEDSDCIWHPFTQMKGADPVHIVKAEGCYLYANDGKKYIDAISSWWVNLHGHAHPFIAQSIATQSRELEHVIFAGFTHTPAIRLATELLSILPGFSKVFYSDNGSTAVEVALKMSLQYWYNRGVRSKTKIIALENAYHGDTFGAMAAGARSTFTAPFQSLFFDVAHIPVPNEQNHEHCIETLKGLAKQENVAAFIFEPLVQGAAGMQMYSAKYLDNLMSIAKESGILCIADEVMTGFGRTGRLFACDYLTQKPDIICLSKGITGGFLPLGATICTAEIYNEFYSDDASRTFFHGHSYTANPLSCAAAIASLELLTAPECQEKIVQIEQHHDLFLQMVRDDDFVKEARRTGTILAIEMNSKEGSSYFHTMKEDAYKFCLNRGVLLRPLGNILYCMPPYCINADELTEVHQVMNDAIVFLKSIFWHQ